MPKEAVPIKLLLQNFFTHKDFLPTPDQWPGTLFTPLQIGFSVLVAVFIAFAAIRCAKKPEVSRHRVIFVLWLIMLVTEPAIVLWEAMAGRALMIDWTSALSLWPCSIFLYTAPFALYGKGWVKRAACGYICTLGLLGGTVNFVYPATYLARYSCLSMAGFRTIFYHGSMVFTAVTLLLSGEHAFSGVTHWKQLIIPAIPALVTSVAANIANALIPGADYMFYRMDSFFFAPVGRILPGWLCALLVAVIYLIIHAVPYLPSYLAYRKTTDVQA